MNPQMILFAVLAFAAVFALAAPMDYAAAQPSDSEERGEGQYHDGESGDGKYHDGERKKSCPFKDKKTASTIAGIY